MVIDSEIADEITLRVRMTTCPLATLMTKVRTWASAVPASSSYQTPCAWAATGVGVAGSWVSGAAGLEVGMSLETSDGAGWGGALVTDDGAWAATAPDDGGGALATSAPATTVLPRGGGLRTADGAAEIGADAGAADAGGAPPTGAADDGALENEDDAAPKRKKRRKKKK